MSYALPRHPPPSLPRTPHLHHTMAFLAGIANGAKSLQKVEASATSDRSAVNLANATPDVLEDEAERWKYFFESGLNSWFEDIKEHGLKFGISTTGIKRTRKQKRGAR